MKVTIEHNGETIWYRDSENGVGMASSGYQADGTQQKIITALIDALEQANGEMLPPQPLGEVCLTFSDEQLKQITEDLRLSRVSMPQLYSSRDITINSPKITFAGNLTPSAEIRNSSIERLKLLQAQIESSLKYISSGQCEDPEMVATADLESLLSYHQSKLDYEQGNKDNHPIRQWGKWQRHP